MFLDKSFCGCVYSFLQSVCSGVEVLGLRIGVYLMLLETAK